MFIRRWSARLVAAVGMGAVTTLAVAWGIATWSTWEDPHNGIGRLQPDGSEIASVRVDQVWQVGSLARSVKTVGPEAVRGGDVYLPFSIEAFTVLERVDVDTTWGLAKRALREGEENLDGAEYARGWPRLAFYHRVDDSIWAAKAGEFVGGGWVIEDVSTTGGVSYVRVMPLIPLWRGVAVDSAIYGGVWVVVLSGPLVARAWRRRRRGWCPECGYDLKAEWKAGCSECGWNREAAAQERS